MAVQIHLLADVNPKRSPTYADLQTTAGSGTPGDEYRSKEVDGESAA